jgi:hypothetical protein
MFCKRLTCDADYPDTVTHCDQEDWRSTIPLSLTGEGRPLTSYLSSASDLDRTLSRHRCTWISMLPTDAGAIALIETPLVIDMAFSEEADRQLSAKRGEDLCKTEMEGRSYEC